MPYQWTEPTDPVEREALALAARASEAWHQKQFAVARELVNKGLSSSQEAHYTLGIMGAQHLLANIAFDEGDLCTARALHEEVLAGCQRLDWPEGIASTLNGLGVVAEREGRYAEAYAHLEKSVRILEELGSIDMAGQVRKNLDRVSALCNKDPQ